MIRSNPSNNLNSKILRTKITVKKVGPYVGRGGTVFLQNSVLRSQSKHFKYLKRHKQLNVQILFSAAIILLFRKITVDNLEIVRPVVDKKNT